MCSSPIVAARSPHPPLRLQRDVAGVLPQLQSITVAALHDRRPTVLIASWPTKTRPHEDSRRRRRRAPARPADPLSGRTGIPGRRRCRTRATSTSKLQRDPPHLVVLDLMLPGEDGLSVCRRLRGAGESVPIIMLTAKGEDVDRIVGLEMGADDYLPKPFNPRELVARIHAVLRRHGERQRTGRAGRGRNDRVRSAHARPRGAERSPATAATSR